MSAPPIPDLLESCWIIEAARSVVLSDRGETEPANRVAARARLLASACADRQRKFQPRWAGEHARWMAAVAGSQDESGALGSIFLQRLGMYVDSHLKDYLSDDEHSRLTELSAPDKNLVMELIASKGFPQFEGFEPPAPDVVPADDGSGLTFAIMADPHIAPARPSDAEDGEGPDNLVVEQGLQALKEQGVGLLLIPGDLTTNGEEAAFREAQRLISRLGVPAFVTLGNHDMAATAKNGQQGAAKAPGPGRFKSVFNSDPFVDEEHEGVRFVLLPSAIPLVSPFAPFDIMGGDFTDAEHDSVPWGAFSDEVKDQMAGMGPSHTARFTFIFLHHPPYPYLGFPPLVFGLDESSTVALAGLVETLGADAVFCGHTHRTNLGEISGAPVIEVPSCRHWPFSAGIVRVGDTWSFGLRRLAQPPDGQPNDYAGYLFRRYARGLRPAWSYDPG